MAHEIQLIPTAELATGQAAAIRNGAVKAVLALASKCLNKPESQLVVRDIQPKVDLGYTYATWAETTTTTANAYETMTSGTMSNDRWVGIYGVNDASPNINVSKIKVKVGNSEKAVWFLENLYSETGGPRQGFAPSVVVIPELVPYLIQRYVTNTSVATHIILKGFTVEPMGKTISP